MHVYKITKATITFIWLTLDWFLWNVIVEDFSEICQEDRGVIKIWQQ
jgi:hypothetical protein